MIYVFLAKGFEEIEALTVVDFLRRCKLEVYTVGVGSKLVTGSHNIPVFCDLEDREVAPHSDLEAVVLPGGMPGTLNLEADGRVNEFIDYCFENNKLICAICAAPSILGHKGLLKGRKATCFPGFENELDGAEYTGDYAVCDGNIITGKGMGSAISFSQLIAEQFIDKKEAEEIKNSLQCPF